MRRKKSRKKRKRSIDAKSKNAFIEAKSPAGDFLVLMLYISQIWLKPKNTMAYLSQNQAIMLDFSAVIC